MEHVDWIPSKWAGGTKGMTPEQKGVYIDLINEMYLIGDAIPEDHAWLAGICGAHLRTLRRVLDELIKLGKIHRIAADPNNGEIVTVEGFRRPNGESIVDHSTKLLANRVETELGACQKRMANARSNGKRGGRPSRKSTTCETQPVNQGVSAEKTPGFATRLNKTITPLPHEDSDQEAGAATTIEGSCETVEPSTDTAAALSDLVQSLKPSEPKPTSREAQLNPRALGTNPRAVAQRPVPPAPTPEGGPPEVTSMFEALRSEVGESAFRAWLAPLRVVELNGSLRIRAPTEHIARFVRERYAVQMEGLLGCPLEILT